MTRDEASRLLDSLPIEADERQPPDNHRRGQFRAGWEDVTVRGREYSPETLRALTWHNLGYRVGQALGPRDPVAIDETFEQFADLFREGMGVKSASGGAWTNTELEASVRAYLQILAIENSGDTANKAAFNRKLRRGPLSARSKGSVELRMANISAVLDELGKPWIKGYLPRSNVGKGVKERLRAILESYEPTADAKELGERVKKLLARTLIGMPTGVEKPEQIEALQRQYKRDPHVKAWVLQKAKGICELCQQPAPFKDASGSPFLEVHHVQPLAKGGPDTVSNAVALCPNCHRRCHYSIYHEAATALLRTTVERLKP